MAMGKVQLTQKLEENRVKSEALRTKICNDTQQMNDVQKDFLEIEKIAGALAKEFRDTNFKTKVAEKQQYDENTNFTENNVGMYLAELEEYISTLITYTAYSKDDPNAPISVVPLAEIPYKDWAKRDLQIDAPWDVMVKTDAGEEEESTYDMDVLRERFADKIEKNLVMPLGKGEYKAQMKL